MEIVCVFGNWGAVRKGEPSEWTPGALTPRPVNYSGHLYPDASPGRSRGAAATQLLLQKDSGVFGTPTLKHLLTDNRRRQFFVFVVVFVFVYAEKQEGNQHLLDTYNMLGTFCHMTLSCLLSLGSRPVPGASPRTCWQPWRRRATPSPSGSGVQVLRTSSATNYVNCLSLTFWKEFPLRGIGAHLPSQPGLLWASRLSGCWGREQTREG